MISVNSIGQNMTTDGQQRIPNRPTATKTESAAVSQKVNEEMSSTAQDIAKELENVKKTISQIQERSGSLGTKLRFNVNEQLGKVIVKVVDPNTDKVIKEIPSEDLQQLQLHLKESMGFLFDQKI